jgi:predicted XRE-type DNA-binding protein
MPPTVREVVTPMPQRLAAAAAAVDDAAVALQLARKQRDQLVRLAVDSGELSQRATATAAGITVPRVSAILGTRDDDDE